MWKLRKYFKPYLKECILGPFFKFLEAAFELIVPLIMMDIMENGIRNNDTKYIVIRGIILLLMGIIGLCFSLTCQWFASKASQGFGRDLRNEVFKHINKMSFEDLNMFGESTLITKCTNDIYQAQNGLAFMIRLLVRAPFLVIGSIILAFILDPKFGLIFLVIAPIVTIILLIILSITSKKFTNIQNNLDDLSLLAKENLEGTRVIRAFSKQEKNQQNFEKENNSFTNKNIQVGKIQALLNPITFVVIQLGMIVILYWGNARISNFEVGMTQEKVIAFINYMTQISIAIVAMANLFVLLTKANASANRIVELLNFIPEEDCGFRTELPETNIVYEAKNLGFHYRDSDNPSLSSLHFVIKKGESFGIIGGTGCGKSTLANILAGYYAPKQGTLNFYGVPFSEFTRKTRNDHIGFVFQRASLLSGTIESNLKMGKNDISLERINCALEISQAKEFVDQKGLNYPVETDGKNLSGGQKQRLCIARALASNPEVCILDDSSSALDFKTDASLRHALNNDMPEMTKIIISQRCSTLLKCDQILVLANGEMVGLGTHEELLKNCSVYQEIYASQTKNGGVDHE